MARRPLGLMLGLVFLAGAFTLGGCGTMSGGLHADTQALLVATVTAPDAAETAAPAAEPAESLGTVSIQPPDLARDDPEREPTSVSEIVPAASTEPVELLPMEPITDAQMTPYLLALAETMTLAQATREGGPPLEPPLEEYDPWEAFNERMFIFNYNADKYFFRPVAKAYNFVVPDELQRMIDRGFQNINFVPRFVNNLLQAKWGGAGRELARFLINSTIGIGGLWDMARQEWGIEASKEDFGQTLGVWGVGPGPFLVLPFMAPMTVRDGIGIGVDGAMDPLSYFIPFIWERLVMKVVNLVNDRSLNLEFFEGVEETTVDLYTAVRNAYLQRRARQIAD
ncbi:MAG TPA: VacJ family lipoprotein [Methylomirabilota bacterium]|nr:VacJ family lipoprotein [Methylomirabilota bacterium]